MVHAGGVSMQRWLGGAADLAAAANAAVVAAHLVAAIASSERNAAHDRGNVVLGSSVAWAFSPNGVTTIGR